MAPLHPGQGAAAQRLVTLVHGTRWRWSKDAEWTKDGSPLRRALEDIPGTLVHVHDWTGRNRHRDRVVAGRELAARLRRQFQSAPNAEHFVIAHSHGGNIALYASRDDEVAKHLTGIVCLSTPFLHFRGLYRREDTRIILALLVLLLSPVAAWYFGPSLPWSMRCATKALTSLCALAVVAYWVVYICAYRAMKPMGFQRHNDDANQGFIETNLRLPSDPTTAILNVRFAGDEAAGALGTVFFATWLEARLASGIRRLGATDLAPWLAVAVLFTMPLVILAHVFRNFLPSWVRLLIVRLWDVSTYLPKAVYHAPTHPANFLLAMLLEFGVFPVALSVAVAFPLAALALLRALIRIAFGYETALFTSSVVVTAEAAPPGSSEMVILDAEGAETGKAHSASHSHPMAVARVVSWIQRQNGGANALRSLT